ncbi:RND transporter MFP subunit [Edaphobacter acidisoli]|uniref:RND transporter MFP subunit n=1 Tax=Edaphobacter acidisoli TaxID=2040573 RepID=A0A916W9X8_9BACT|nr:efflux RND transporter periplasmic adaptor subunit [Edaphobacter acidisoli]GGA80025.1 RND transporter MFP subunit [Edaphobacter acidisoli]
MHGEYLIHRDTPRMPGWSAMSMLLAAGAIATGLALSGCDSRMSGPPASAAAVSKVTQPVQVDTVRVISKRLNMEINLPGELQPYEEVRIFPRVSGYLKWIGVDRGSVVKQGQLVAVLEAPEIVAQKAEAQAKVFSAENQRLASEAKLSADESTYERLKDAAKTPGVISDEELDVAQRTAEGDRARVVALRNTVEAARANLRSALEMESYLRIIAPFDGVVTKRNVHPGALVGPGGGSGTEQSMLRIEQIAHLRLVVAVPEIYVAGVKRGEKVSFTVPAFPGRTFTGVVARPADSVDATTRTMPVEMDVWNRGGELHSGMFPDVRWPVHRPEQTLFVPQTAVARNMEQSYVLCIRGGKIEQVSVKTGGTVGRLTEVFGQLNAGDEVAVHTSEDLRPGTAAVAHFVADDGK